MEKCAGRLKPSIDLYTFSFTPKEFDKNCEWIGWIISSWGSSKWISLLNYCTGVEHGFPLLSMDVRISTDYRENRFPLAWTWISTLKWLIFFIILKRRFPLWHLFGGCIFFETYLDRRLWKCVEISWDTNGYGDDYQENSDRLHHMFAEFLEPEEKLYLDRFCPLSI